MRVQLLKMMGLEKKIVAEAKKKICSVVVQYVPGHLMLTRFELTASVSVRASLLMEFLLPMTLTRLLGARPRVKFS